MIQLSLDHLVAALILLFFALSFLTGALTLLVLNRWMPMPDLKDGDCELCGKHQQTYDGLCSDCFDNQ